MALIVVSELISNSFSNFILDLQDESASSDDGSRCSPRPTDSNTRLSTRTEYPTRCDVVECSGRDSAHCSLTLACGYGIVNVNVIEIEIGLCARMR
jgi:hypothetical protein